MLQELYHGRLNLSRLNYGVISLLPKIKDANSILQYRPICVLNVMFKAITKALTLRFTPLARQVISSLQTGFIPGRYILDGCVILHEVLHELKTSHSEGILLQLDFEKAYDRVQWPFLAEVMHRKNFPTQWKNLSSSGHPLQFLPTDSPRIHLLKSRPHVLPLLLRSLQ